MTKLEKDQILKAAKLIFEYRQRYSCTALLKTCDLHDSYSLIRRYSDMFKGKALGDAWLDANLRSMGIGDSIEYDFLKKDLRIMLLLLFREAGE